MTNHCQLSPVRIIEMAASLTDQDRVEVSEKTSICIKMGIESPNVRTERHHARCTHANRTVPMVFAPVIG